MSYSYIYHKPTQISPRKNSLTSEDATAISEKLSGGGKFKELKETNNAIQPVQVPIKSEENIVEKENPYSAVAKMRSRMNAASAAAGSSVSTLTTKPIDAQRHNSLVLKLGHPSAPSKSKKTVAMWQKEREMAACDSAGARPSTGSGRYITKSAKTNPFAAKVSNIAGDPERPESQSRSESAAAPTQQANAVPKIPMDPNRIPNTRKKEPPRPMSHCKIVKQCEKCKMLFNVHHVCQ